MRYDRTIRGGAVAGALLLAVTVGGCDFIETTQVDPNTVPDAAVDQLFTGVQVNTFYLNESQISRLSSMWTQQMAGTDRQFAILDEYVFTEEEADTEWTSFYAGGGLIDVNEAIRQAEEGELEVYAGILKIYKAWQMGMAASIFGDIPYSEAADPEIEHPSLDDQAAVYDSVQAVLDEAIADLEGSGGPGEVDMNFQGESGPWTEVAYTLKARFHMHWEEYDEAIAAAENGISTAANNWEAVHSTTSTEQNLWHQFMRDRSGYISAGDYMVPLMRGDSAIIEGDEDPRVGHYFTSVEIDTDEDEEADTIGYVPRESTLNTASGAFGGPGQNFPILTCAENNFILAEAYHATGEDDPVAAAQDALACQEEYYGVDLSDESAALEGLTDEDLLEEIMNQKYIALFLNIEAWNDYLRTCYPDITPKGGADDIPARLLYGQTERQTNPNIPAPSQQPERNPNDTEACNGA